MSYTRGTRHCKALVGLVGFEPTIPVTLQCHHRQRMAPDLRRCARCQEWLPVEDFNFRDESRRLRQSYCRPCSRLNWREWYAVLKNKAHHIEVLETRRRRLRLKNREYVRQLKSQPCTDCGGRFPPEVMDFDHLGNKSALISKLVYQAG